MGRKRLYVISSLHFGGDADIEQKYHIQDILEARLAAIKSISRGIKNGAYFADRMNEQISECFNKLLDLASGAPEILEQGARDFYYRGKNGRSMYDNLMTLSAFASLRPEGINIECMPTEGLPRGRYGDLTQFTLISPWKEPGSILRRIRKDPFLAEMVNEKKLRMRDEEIINNVVTHGMDENILYVGYAHRLVPLLYAPLEWYALQISPSSGPVTVSGFIPKRFRENFKDMPQETRSGRKVEININYQGHLKKRR